MLACRGDGGLHLVAIRLAELRHRVAVRLQENSVVADMPRNHDEYHPRKQQRDDACPDRRCDPQGAVLPEFALDVNDLGVHAASFAVAVAVGPAGCIMATNKSATEGARVSP